MTVYALPRHQVFDDARAVPITGALEGGKESVCASSNVLQVHSLPMHPSLDCGPLPQALEPQKEDKVHSLPGHPALNGSPAAPSIRNRPLWVPGKEAKQAGNKKAKAGKENQGRKHAGAET
eukprot:1144495-Pelagomonas_calceolata.AAC.1